MSGKTALATIYTIYIMAQIISALASPFPNWVYPVQMAMCGGVAWVAYKRGVSVPHIMRGALVIVLPMMVLALPNRGLAGDGWSVNPNAIGGAAIVALAYFPRVAWVSLPALVWLSRGAALGLVAALVHGRRWWIVALLFIPIALWRPQTIMSRAYIWSEAARLFMARPLLGWGPNTYGEISAVEDSKPHADNLPLTVAAEGGIIGLFTLALVAVAAWRTAPPRARPALIALAVHNVVDAPVMVVFVLPLVLLVLSDTGMSGRSEISILSLPTNRFMR